MLADRYLYGCLTLVVEDLVKVADELGVGLLMKVYRHYLVDLAQGTIDNELVLFFDFAPHLHLL